MPAGHLRIERRTLPWRGLDGDCHGFGEGGLDLVADLHQGKLFRVGHAQVHRALRAAQRQCLRAGVHRHDIGDDRDAARHHAAGLGPGRGAVARRAFDALANSTALPEFDRHRLEVADDDLVADLELVEVAHLGSGNDVRLLTLRVLQRDDALVAVDRGDRRRRGDDFAERARARRLGADDRRLGARRLRDGGSGDGGQRHQDRQRGVIPDERFDAEPYLLPPDEPLTLGSYVAGPAPEAYLEHFAVGSPLAEMPLFLTPDRYVNVPLESTYSTAFCGLPAFWRDVLEGRRSPPHDQR